MLNTFTLILDRIKSMPFKKMAVLFQFMDLGPLDAENFLKWKSVPLKEQLLISSKKIRFFRTEKQFLGTLCSE